MYLPLYVFNFNRKFRKIEEIVKQEEIRAHKAEKLKTLIKIKQVNRDVNCLNEESEKCFRSNTFIYKPYKKYRLLTFEEKLF